MKKTLYSLILASIAALAANPIAHAALQIENAAATNITRISATLHVEVLGTNGTNPTVSLYYGLADGDTNPASWTYSTNIGVVSTGIHQVAISNLTPASQYSYRAFASDAVTSLWASYTTNFITLAGAPTSMPPASTFYVAVDSNGVIVFPLQLMYSNNISITNWVPVDSSTNYLAVDPTTRILTGCITNSNGGAGVSADWSNAVQAACSTVTAQSNGWMIAMTNWVPVESPTNFLSYNPVTRILTGCLSNKSNLVSTDGTVSITTPGGPAPDLSVSNYVTMMLSTNTVIQAGSNIAFTVVGSPGAGYTVTVHQVYTGPYPFGTNNDARLLYWTNNNVVLQYLKDGSWSNAWEFLR